MKEDWRFNLLFGIFIIGILLIDFRLFYWQILNSEQLIAAADVQRLVSFEIPAKRGEILANDGFPLVTNQEVFLVFASLPELKEKPEKIASQIAPFFAEGNEVKKEEEIIRQRLKRDDLVWIALKHRVSSQIKENLEKLKIEGIGFEEEQKRNYPEGSVAAHLLGFVGFDVDGKEKGYFGLEGFYDLELRGIPGRLQREKDASGKPILVGKIKEEKSKDGRSILTTIDRCVQFIIEEKLKTGIKRYGAKSGSVVILEPQTGAVLGMASFPSYDPANYWKFDEAIFPNPVIASSYEPGSTFKVIVMAAALDLGIVKPETKCSSCSGPRKIGEYTIKTWNDKYYPESTMTEVIQHSDNVGMVFVGEKLGAEKLVEYLKKFGFGEPTGIDLQEESSPSLRSLKEWKPIDVATVSFGQGIAVTPLQMVRAVSVIANGGKLVKPFVVRKVLAEDGEKEISPKVGGSVIKKTTAEVITEMMVNAVDKGEARWAKPEGFRIAGKTGTAQIPVAGHYDEEKTIASFVGFAPADKPKFVMLVTLQEPTSSPWGSETAAPLWFEIARELFTYWGILPE